MFTLGIRRLSYWLYVSYKGKQGFCYESLQVLSSWSYENRLLGTYYSRKRAYLLIFRNYRSSYPYCNESLQVLKGVGGISSFIGFKVLRAVGDGERCIRYKHYDNETLLAGGVSAPLTSAIFLFLSLVSA